MMPHAHLKLVVDVAGKYGLQPQELNISLTAVGLLVSRESYNKIVMCYLAVKWQSPCVC